MNENLWLFIGADKRLSVCSQLMAERGYECIYVGADSYSLQLEETIKKFTPGNIVFPILQMKDSIPVHLLKSGTRLYTGVVSEEWLAPFKIAELEILHYLKNELFIWRNARLTAEAFISEFYSRTASPIIGKCFYVAGYGRVGKMIALVLSSLGANVSILARSDVQLGEAKANGYQSKRLTDEVTIENGYLINTIPAQWISEKSTIKSPIFELASAPGCLRNGSMHEYYTVLPGLPGIHFPNEAAAALADALEGMHRR
jgi:dipicolinate synthase subunit A